MPTTPTTAEALADPTLRERLYAHAEACYPSECCALLVADGDTPALRLADNLAAPEEAHRRYVLDPGAVMAALTGGLQLLAIVHSHCDVGAYFSNEDRAGAVAPDTGAPLYPGVDYVVLDVRDGAAQGARLFRWHRARGDYVEVPPTDGDRGSAPA